jgi:hypothetical protein
MNAGRELHLNRLQTMAGTDSLDPILERDRRAIIQRDDEAVGCGTREILVADVEDPLLGHWVPSESWVRRCGINSLILIAHCAVKHLGNREAFDNACIPIETPFTSHTRNFAGVVLLELNTLEPAALIGCRIWCPISPAQIPIPAYCTFNCPFTRLIV